MSKTKGSVRYGFIYVLRNECMPGIYMVGLTDRMPTQKAEEFSSLALIPEPFEIVCYGLVPGADEFKRVLHDEFRHLRISAGRDFFRLDDHDLIELGLLLEDRVSRGAGRFVDRHLRFVKAMKEGADAEAVERFLATQSSSHGGR